MDEYDKMHELEKETKLLQHKADELHRQLTDIEAERFADKCEFELDLARWNDGIAAHVGHDLEEVADKLIAAIEAERRGEDVRGRLYDIHGDVCSIMGDLMSFDPDEEEVAQ